MLTRGRRRSADVTAERLFRVGEVEPSAAVAYRCARSFCSARPTIAATAGGIIVSGGGSRQYRDDDVRAGVGSKRRRPRQQFVQERAKLKRSVC